MRFDGERTAVDLVGLVGVEAFADDLERGVGGVLVFAFENAERDALDLPGAELLFEVLLPGAVTVVDHDPAGEVPVGLVGQANGAVLEIGARAGQNGQQMGGDHEQTECTLHGQTSRNEDREGAYNSIKMSFCQDLF